MDHEYWINYIIADYTPLTFGDRYFYISSPSREYKFLAEELFLNMYRSSLEDGVLSEGETAKLLEKYGLWNKDSEKLIVDMVKDVENIKVQLFENYLRTDIVRDLKKALKLTEDKLSDLYEKKNTFYSVTAKSIAQYCRQHFLMGCSIFTSRRKPYWKNPLKCWSIPDEVLNSAYVASNKHIMTETDYREISRGSVWRNIWTAKKGVGNLFGRAVVDLSHNQRNLISWSSLYDNVYAHQNCPSDGVIDDDDILDGWMIKQKRLRDIELAKASMESTINPKILNCEEVFIVTSGDNFDTIYNMNDMAGKVGFQRRMAQIKRDGCVDESNMIDRRLAMQGRII